MTTGKSPQSILGVPASATPEQVRLAYLERIREFPPDRSPEEFQRIRAAYEMIRDPYCLFENLIATTRIEVLPLDLLGDEGDSRHCFASLDFWLQVIKK